MGKTMHQAFFKGWRNCLCQDIFEVGGPSINHTEQGVFVLEVGFYLRIMVTLECPFAICFVACHNF